ncbi:MAG: four helix bundle protein [Patescibacteria group bacterium]
MTGKKLNFYNLEVWRLGMDLVHFIYKLTKRFPREEMFGLSSQIKRAAISVPLNIAEGAGRRTSKDFANFIRNSIASALEVLTCGEIALQEEFIVAADFNQLEMKIEEIYFKLIALEKSILNKRSD